MTAFDPASLFGTLLGLQLGAADEAAGNRFLVEGLTVATEEGGLEVRVEKLEVSLLHLASGPLDLAVGRLALRKLVARAGIHQQGLQLLALQAEGAELAGLKVHGPWVLPRQPAHGGHAAPVHWTLGPLAAANGTIRAEIVDAHLLFDADVTVPIQQGQIDFNKATVEHVGPDSRMGISRLGLYVDAPNGRSYLYQFASPPVSGVHYERRGALLGARVSDRGNLQLQAFAEALLLQGMGGRDTGFTDQARLLLGRTAVAGEVRLGDGELCAPGVRAEIWGRGEGRNAVRIHSEAVGRGVTAEMGALAIRGALLERGGMWGRAEAIEGSVKLRLAVEDGELRFALEAGSVKLEAISVVPDGQAYPSARNFFRMSAMR